MPTSPGPFVHSFTTLWTRLREGIPQLPPVRPALSPTPLRLDHGPTRWTWEGDTVTGLVVSASTLQEGPEATVEFVLHEAAHILCWLRNIRDTTMRGVYHNGSFLSVAEEVGLEWPDGAERVPGRGYSHMRLSDASKERFASDLGALAEAIPQILPHLAVPTPANSGSPKRLTMQCQCDPPRKIRAGRTVAALGPIDCRVCGEEFTEE